MQTKVVPLAVVLVGRRENVLVVVVELVTVAAVRRSGVCSAMMRSCIACNQLR